MSSSSRTRRIRVGGAAAAGVLALTGASLSIDPAGAAAPATHANGRIKLQVLALNDFHGNLEPPMGSSGRIGSTQAGGAEYLSTTLDNLRAEAAADGAETITVAAGDLVGASPLVSAAFHDEPTIEALNKMGLETASVGNHEFDEGWRELVRLQEGGCLDDGDGANNQNSCPDPEHPFTGADFQYLSANVFHEDTGETVFPGTYVKEVDGVKVGFIGMTLEGTPSIVTASGVAGLRFTDEVRTANRAATQLQKQGVKSIIVLLHEGGFPVDATAYNSCPGISGPIVDINAGLTAKVDAIISGHTHQGYNCTMVDPKGQPRLVTSASSFGRLVTDYQFTINQASGDVDRSATTANNVIVTRTVAKDPEMTELISKYQAYVAPIANEVIGSLASGTPLVSRTQDDSGESPLGNLIADAQRTDPTINVDGITVDAAFMNPGGIRADLVANSAGDVTYAAAYTTQPFNNYVVRMDMTGAQILELLEQQWSGGNATSAKVLQVSGIEYSWSSSAPAGSKVDPSSVMIGGQPLDPNATYHVAANSFLADGGDNFAAFKSATNKYYGGIDLDALATYLGANSPYAPVPTDRIDVTP